MNETASARARRLLVACSFVLWTVSGCKRSSDSSEPSPSARPSAPPAVSAAPIPSASAAAESPPEAPAPRNVLLLTVDSMRAEMPWTGYPRPNAPNLTKLAERATVYTNAYSTSSYTAKSVATLLSGRYPSTLYRDGFFFAKYSGANRFIAEILGERGITTIAWHAHLYFGRGKGLEQGFTEWRLVPGLQFDPETDNSVTSDKMTALGLELLAGSKNTSGQFFAWAHYMDPHDQYKKHAQAPDFGNKARDRYDSELWFTDFWIGKLLEVLEKEPWWKNTVLIVSADHGEAFGDHNMYKHAFELWEVLVRVPLLIAGPGIKAQRIDARRAHIDLPPTIFELMGVPVPADFQGRSLRDELTGKPAESREPLLLELAEDSHNPHRRALIQRDLKLIDFGRSRFQLYDLKNDPGELKDLAAERKEDLERMRGLLDAKYKDLPTVEPYGGAKLKSGGSARGPVGPAK